jgi:hypothetical protein
MRERALFATLLALLLTACGNERTVSWDQLDSGFRADCAPSGDQGVLYAYKGGKRYCFRYTIERITPDRRGPVVIVAQSDLPQAD